MGGPADAPAGGALPPLRGRGDAPHLLQRVAGLVAERRTSVSGGGAVVEAVALWVHIDPATLRPARLGEEFHAVYGESADGRRARSRLRHPPRRPARRAVRVALRAADLDVAGHVNNAAYLEPVEELFLASGEPAPPTSRSSFASRPRPARR